MPKAQSLTNFNPVHGNTSLLNDDDRNSDCHHSSTVRSSIFNTRT